MKRYMLFIWKTYYPEGGMGDIFNSYDELEDAVLAAISELGYGMDEAEVYDIKENNLVKTFFKNDDGEILIT